MNPIIGLVILALAIMYIALQIILHGTQSVKEPSLLESNFPFLDTAIGILQKRVGYFAALRNKYQSSIHTVRMPFQRLYIVHAPHMIHAIQSKANSATFVPNLLDFGMLFSGLHADSKSLLRTAFGIQGNGFTMSVHKYLLSGSSLHAATEAAIHKLNSALPRSFDNNRKGGLLELVRHELTLAMTGAIYGPRNPYEDAEVEESWKQFVPGINHLLYSPMPSLTARSALRARGRVISAFKNYFKTEGHLQAFPMISEMYEINKSHGLCPDEAAKLEMATSLAMLSSGANTAFWLIFQIYSDAELVRTVREELITLSNSSLVGPFQGSQALCLNLEFMSGNCPVLVALLNETFRYHSTVINIKHVQQDTMLENQYLLKKNGIVMIPGQSVHHNMDIWGPAADKFDHTRFLSTASKKNLSNTSAFRPFGAGASMCPGRHFSTNVILSLVAMTVLQYDVTPLEGQWIVPTKLNADLWNAMPKPDSDIAVQFSKRSNEKNLEGWSFSWSSKKASVETA